MSEYWNSRTKNITPYVPGEQPKDRKFIKLNTNENPYPPSPKVIEAIKEAANEDLRLYPDPECTEFREAAADFYDIEPDQVFAGNGSDEILAFAFAAFFESGKDAPPVLFPDITYSFYPVYAELWDVPYKKIPLKEDFSIDLNDYNITSGGVILPNPNAPTGMTVALIGLAVLMQHLKNQGKVLIVDEAYNTFDAPSAGGSFYGSDEAFRESNSRTERTGGQSVAGNYISPYPNMLMVRTMSKKMSLAGLRFGYAVGSKELIEGLCRIRDSFNSYTVDRLALAGATAAIKDYGYYNKINGKIGATRDRVAEELRKMGFTVLPSKANFLFIKAPNTEGSVMQQKLRENGILVRHFNKERIEDFLRVSIGTDEDMDVFLDVCKEIIKK
jgi:histidinol-phosphate aminotransferase